MTKVLEYESDRDILQFFIQTKFEQISLKTKILLNLLNICIQANWKVIKLNMTIYLNFISKK